MRSTSGSGSRAAPTSLTTAASTTAASASIHGSPAPLGTDWKVVPADLVLEPHSVRRLDAEPSSFFAYSLYI